VLSDGERDGERLDESEADADGDGLAETSSVATLAHDAMVEVPTLMYKLFPDLSKSRKSAPLAKPE
jgi:hypothetical protein